MVDGSLYKNPVTRLRQGIYHHANALDHSRHICHPFRLDVLSVMVGNPSAYGRPIFGGFDCIAYDRMLQTVLYGIKNERGSLEIHVCHPLRNQVIASITCLEHLVLKVARPGAVDYLVKIVFHKCFSEIIDYK